MPSETVQSLTEDPVEETPFEFTEKVNSEDHLKDIRKNLNSGGRKAKMKQIILIVLGVLLAGGVVFGAVNYFRGGDGSFLSPLGDGSVTFNEKVINPLTGVENSGKDAKDLTEMRPLAVMVNNYLDARPQSGLIYADFTYEIVAEGGITRFIPFFLSDYPEKVGPVRSTRTYYLTLVKELGDAMVMHIGYSPQAKAVIDEWPVRSLFRGGGESCDGCSWRDNPRNVAYEHTAYVSGEKLVEYGVDELGWGGVREFKIWEFKEDGKGYEDAELASNLAIDFWYEGDYSAIFKYDAQNNVYLRHTGYDGEGNPISLNDQDTGEQVAPKNVIVQFAVETPIVGDDKNRLEYELEGTGEGLIFLDGKVIKATWNKEGRDDRTVFYDMDGNEIRFNRGKFWLSIVPDRNADQVVYN
jgi:hypothetical protein